MAVLGMAWMLAGLCLQAHAQARWEKGKTVLMTLR